MKERHSSICFTALLLVVVFGCTGPVLAGRMVIGHTDSTEPECEPTSGDECSDSSTAGPNGDPKTCGWVVGQTGLDHMECLGEQVCGESDGSAGFDYGVLYDGSDNLPNMNFSLSEGTDCSPPANPGPEDEIFSYCLREDGDIIGYALLEVEQPNLVAKIHEFVENPTSPGDIRIGINNDLVVVDVRPALGSGGRLNKLVCAALQSNFRADCLDDFWVVYADSQGHTPTVLSLYTAVDGVSTTEIALEPVGGSANVTACNELAALSASEPVSISR